MIFFFLFIRNHGIIEFQSDEFVFENQKFNYALESIFEQAKEELGCDKDTSNAIVQRLLICEKGFQFQPNTFDIENEFGTLIIQLPSVFSGNSLLVHYGDQTKTIQFNRKEKKYEIIYSAFYSNCKFETTPLESGYRLVLVYKLTSIDSGELLKRLKESTKIKQQITESLSQVM